MRKDAFVGKWVSSQPFDSDDYLVEYNIRKSGAAYKVTAKDYQDGEAMKVSDLKFDGQTLEFVSLMPSTGRTGVNRFRVKGQDELVSEFTFTVVESLTRMPVKELPAVKPKSKATAVRRKKS
ncbi:hypothetical protein [Bryobacter aggregatus]|uniref:hypothetical protein n=1 Tax=Bryobacter aggregatus TaxID=360054 RepID=UPI0004E0EAE6|nr:hypothetical protein [Bryobacter aggregatus]